jgi:hypothetical protein
MPPFATFANKWQHLPTADEHANFCKVRILLSRTPPTIAFSSGGAEDRRTDGRGSSALSPALLGKRGCCAGFPLRGEIMVNLMTESEVSKRLNVSVASLRRWRLLKRGPAFLKVGSLVRYQPEDLDAWLASLPTGGGIARHEQLPSGQSIR